MLTRDAALQKAKYALEHAKLQSFDPILGWDKFSTATGSYKLMSERLEPTTYFNRAKNFLERQGISATIINVKSKTSSSVHNVLLVNHDKTATGQPNTWGDNAVIINPQVTGKVLNQFGIKRKDLNFGVIFPANQHEEQLFFPTPSHSDTFRHDWQKFDGRVHEFALSKPVPSVKPIEDKSNKDHYRADRDYSAGTPSLPTVKDTVAMRLDFTVAKVRMPQPEPAPETLSVRRSKL